MKIAAIMEKLEQSGALLIGRAPKAQVKFRCGCGKIYLKSISNVMKPGAKNRCQDCFLGRI